MPIDVISDSRKKINPRVRADHSVSLFVPDFLVEFARKRSTQQAAHFTQPRFRSCDVDRLPTRFRAGKLRSFHLRRPPRGREIRSAVPRGWFNAMNATNEIGERHWGLFTEPTLSRVARVVLFLIQTVLISSVDTRQLKNPFTFALSRQMGHRCAIGSTSRQPDMFGSINRPFLVIFVESSREAS